jgi:hypothetical protein
MESNRRRICDCDYIQRWGSGFESERRGKERGYREMDQVEDGMSEGKYKKW